MPTIRTKSKSFVLADAMPNRPRRTATWETRLAYASRVFRSLLEGAAVPSKDAAFALDIVEQAAVHASAVTAVNAARRGS